ncbi:unnamed protein product [Periconia digitata]|uniref:Ketoreductase domain-containing protein n=1 Tax=Periconia digitata TaxID=1303443 RepID=A0A9W4XE96_9PLEO|nr:unnamed protein product [Periconia digitata]
MAPLLPSPVPTWHNDTYASIDPTKGALSQKGKTVIITGAGSGIGRATAIAFSQANADHIVLTGRTESKLRETESLIRYSNKDVQLSIVVGSVTDETQMKEAASNIGPWDILILNAAVVNDPKPILSQSVEEAWSVVETNFKSIFVMAHAFLGSAKESAGLFNIGAAGSALPARVAPNIGPYVSSKAGVAKLVEHLAIENSQVLMCTVHPGVIPTPMLQKSGMDESSLPFDTVELAAHFLVWLSQTEKTRFLHGKYVYANSDVDELSAKAQDIKVSDENTTGVIGWPFGYEVKF